MERRRRFRPWLVAALGLAMVAAGLYGWWSAGRVRDAATPGGPVVQGPGGEESPPAGGGGTEPGDPRPASPEEPGRGGPEGGTQAGSPLWPVMEPFSPGPGTDVYPRPVMVGSELASGAMVVDGDRLLFVSAGGERSEVFRLPEGHAWASPLAPSPTVDAVAFITRAEAGTHYLWVLRSDLEYSPHALPEAIVTPGALAWAGDAGILAGDPPHFFDIRGERWSKLPGDVLVRPGPSSPDGHWVVYTAREGRAGSERYRLYVRDLRRGSTRAVDVDAGVPYPGPWLDEGRALVGLGDPPRAGAPPVHSLAVLDVARGSLEALTAPSEGKAGLLPVGVSPDRGWAVVAPAAPAGTGDPSPGGAWRLIDLEQGTVRELGVRDAVVDAAWSVEDNRLYYLRPAGGAAVEVLALSLPAGEVATIGRLDPSPARIGRLLGVEAGKLWLELQVTGEVPALALWDADTGRLTPVTGQ